MKILSDIIMHSYTSDDIIIESLASYQELMASDFQELYMRLKTNAELTPNVIFAGRSGSKYDSFRLEESITNNIHSSVKLYHMTCKVAELDDALLKDLDPLLLSEMYYYKVGTQLVTEILKIQNQLNIRDDIEQTAQLKLSLDDILLLAALSYYDEYLVMHFDKYSMDDMDKKNIL